MKIAVVGLGSMGFGMANSLIRQGHDVWGHDINAQRVGDLENAGGKGAIAAADPYTPSAGSITDSFDLMAQKVVTTIDFDSSYGINAWLNDNQATITVAEESGKMSFTVTGTTVYAGDVIRYDVFRTKVKQRQSVSKALKPTADF